MASSDRQGLHVEVVGRPGETRGLARWLARTAPARARGHLTVALVSDPAMRTLNRQYRGVDRVTDVLSFSADSAEASAPKAVAPAARRASGGASARRPAAVSGDVAIARGVAARQARAHGHSVSTEMRVLALHGLLHLLGYDHEHARDGGAMARVEARLRRRGGLPAGLIARSRHGDVTPAAERRRR